MIEKLADFLREIPIYIALTAGCFGFGWLPFWILIIMYFFELKAKGNLK